MVSCLTDNKNRTVAEVRHAFSKAGGAMGADGSVAFLRKVGLIEGALDVSEEQAFELFIDLGASEFEKNSNGNWVIETDVPNLQTLTQALTAKEMSVERLKSLIFLIKWCTSTKKSTKDHEVY